MHALSKHASDRFAALASATLPFVFVAKHDTHPLVREQFVNTWNEAVGGSRAVSLYLTEVLSLATTHLDSPQWTLKHTSARAVADAVGAVVGASADGALGGAVASQLWGAVERALGGKTWEGKEVVLEAFVKFVQAAKGWWMEKEEVKSAIVKVSFVSYLHPSHFVCKCPFRTCGCCCFGDQFAVLGGLCISRVWD